MTTTARPSWIDSYRDSPRLDLASIFKAGLDRADPLAVMASCLGLEGDTLVATGVAGGGGAAGGSGGGRLELRLGDFDRVLVLGFGKASPRMALGLEALLGDRIAGGLVVTKPGCEEGLARCRVRLAAHPVPDASSVEAAREVLAFARAAGPRDLVLTCVSGGASALLCAPAFGLDLEDKRAVTSLLLASGATIQELNCVRKHLSAIKGGRLAEALSPATSVNLVLSDVMGDDLSTIASGPTVPDPTTWREARDILARRGLLERVPAGVAALFETGAAGGLGETPKPGDAAFGKVHNLLAGGNLPSLEAAAAEARRRGYRPLILTSRLEGEAREVAKVFVAIAQDLTRKGLPLAPPACVLAGGETTVTLRGGGRGGRNQEMALAFLEAARRGGLDLSRASFLAGATDGSDGPTEAAGGIVDDASARMAEASPDLVERALADNDSNACLAALESLLVTGGTGTNVCDLSVLLVR